MVLSRSLVLLVKAVVLFTQTILNGKMLRTLYYNSARRDRDRDGASSLSAPRGSRSNFTSASRTPDSGWGTIASQVQRKSSFTSSKESVDQTWGSWGSSSNKGRQDTSTSGEKSPGHGWGSDNERDGWKGSWGSGEKSPGHGWGNDTGNDGWSSKGVSKDDPWGWGKSDTSATQSSSRNSQDWGSSFSAPPRTKEKITSTDDKPSRWGAIPVNDLRGTNTSAGDSDSRPKPLDPPPRPLPLPTHQKESTRGHASTNDRHALPQSSGPRSPQLFSPAQEQGSWDVVKDSQPKVRDPRRPLQAVPVLRSSEKSLHSSSPLSTSSGPAPPKEDILPDQKLTNSSSVARLTDKGTSRLPPPLPIKTTGIVSYESLHSSVPDSPSPIGAPNLGQSSNQTSIQVYTTIIRCILQAVRLHSELTDALSKIENLKRLRASQQFNRATLATQTMFGDRRTTYGHMNKTVESQLRTTVKRLSELPRIATRLDLEAVEANEQELKEYLAQLGDWIAKIRAVYHSSSASVPEHEPSSTITEKPKHPKEIMWDEIEKSIESFDDHINIVEEILYSKQESSVDVISEITAMQAALEAQKISERETKKAALEKEAETLEADVKDMMETVTQMSNVIGENARFLATLEQELQECEAINEQFASNLALLEAWKQADASSISQLRQQIKTLHSTPPPTRAPSFDLCALKTQTEEGMINHMRGEVIQLVNRLREASRENSEVVIEEIFKKLDPILEKTNEVCRRADAITVRLPSIPQVPNLVPNPQFTYAARFARAAGLPPRLP
ncbi:hypothetical protein H0H92_002142 [Tricholoma furcatifolium]|nr:hypothetical protein H0H92_002142 [Tricholoma furcatifolium]